MTQTTHDINAQRYVEEYQSDSSAPQSATTHDAQVERLEEPYVEPDPNTQKSSGYADRDDNYAHLNRKTRFEEVLEQLIQMRDSLTPERLAVIQEALSSNKQNQN